MPPRPLGSDGLDYSKVPRRPLSDRLVVVKFRQAQVGSKLLITLGRRTNILTMGQRPFEGCNILTLIGMSYESKKMLTVFPHIRPAGIIFLQGLQLRALLERGY